MTWKTSKKGWLLREVRDGEGRRICRIVLRPVSEKNHPEKGVVLPATAPVYVVGTLRVDEEFRGRGFALGLLRQAALCLGEIHGEAWLGLMTDNLRLPAGRTRTDIRGAWDSFVSGNPDDPRNGGFILVSSDSK